MAAGAAPRGEPTISGRRYPHDPEPERPESSTAHSTNDEQDYSAMNLSEHKRAVLRRWALNREIAEQVVDDPRMPHDPMTLPDLAYQVCLEEDGTADETAVRARMKAIQVWAAEDDFPPPAIPNPPRIGRGARPDIYSKAEVFTWRSSLPSGHRRSHDPLPLGLVDPNKLYTLGGFARTIGVDNKSVTQARDASLERIRQGTGREKDGDSIEIPDPEEGEHGQRGVKYRGEALVRWWNHRPGKGRGGGRKRRTASDEPPHERSPEAS